MLRLPQLFMVLWWTNSWFQSIKWDSNKVIAHLQEAFELPFKLHQTGPRSWIIMSHAKRLQHPSRASDAEAR